MDINQTIDVIVPCYNVERALDRCIQSLITQNYPKDKYHCFFINDASTIIVFSLMMRQQIKHLKYWSHIKTIVNYLL